MGELRWTIISANDGSRILEHDPKGWESLTLKFVRDEFYHGVFYEFSGGGSEVVPVGFYCKGGGKEFIDSLYDKYGQEADAYMKIEYRCQDGSFEELYYGKLNFASYTEQFENQKLYSYLNIEQFGITQKVRNREEVPVNVCGNVSLDGLPLNHYSPCYNLNLHSRSLFIVSEWDGDVNDEFCVGSANPSTYNWMALPRMTATNKEIDVSIDQFFEGRPFGTFEALSPTIEPIIDFSAIYTYPFSLNLTWNIAGDFIDSSYFLSEVTQCSDPQMISRTTSLDPIKLRLFYGIDLDDAVDNSRFIDIITIPAYAATTQTETKAFTTSGVQTQTITIESGYKLWLLWFGTQEVLDEASLKKRFEYSVFDFTADFASQTPATVAKSALIHEAWSRLSETITDQQIAFKSEYYGRTNSQPVNYSSNGCNSFAAITSGKNIRTFPDEPITISLKDMFSNCNGVDNIGLGIENGNTIRVEPKKFFYDDTVIFEKPYVPGIEIKFSGEFVFNEIEIGYEKWEIDQINGIDEPNSERKFSLSDIRAIKKNLLAKSNFIAGSYPIEATRRKNLVLTEDYRYDYDIFLIALNRTVNGDNQPTQLNTAEKDENFDSITNVFFPDTGYNFRYSPTMNLLRWFPVYSIGMNKVINYQNYWIIILTDYEGNVEMTTRLSLHAEPKCPGEFGYEQGGFFIPLTLVEKPQYQSPVGSGVVSGYPVPLAPFSVEQLYGEPLFMPEEITFEHPVSYSEFKTIKNNPKGLVRISADGINYMSGYIKTFEFDLRRKMGSFVLYRKS